jgi:hypothetical protein
MTKRSACHSSSIEHDLLSTRPASMPVDWTSSNDRSVAMFDAFFGHATQSPPDGASAFASDPNLRRNPDLRVSK